MGFFCNEMLMIYFSSFDVSFVLFYPCGRNLSDLAIFIYLLINLQIRWISLLGMTSKFEFMYLHFRKHKNGVFNLHYMPELYFVMSQVSVAFFRWDGPCYTFSTAIYWVWVFFIGLFFWTCSETLWKICRLGQHLNVLCVFVLQ